MLHVRVLFSPGAAVVQVGVFSAVFTHTWKTDVPQKAVWGRNPVQVGVFSADFAHTWTSPLGARDSMLRELLRSRDLFCEEFLSDDADALQPSEKYFSFFAHASAQKSGR